MLSGQGLGGFPVVDIFIESTDDSPPEVGTRLAALRPGDPRLGLTLTPPFFD